MSKAIEYVVIVSKARSKDNKVLVVTASAKDNSVYVSPQEYGNEYQLWEKREIRSNNPNAYALINKATKTCMARESGANGSKIILGSVADAAINDMLAWRDDTVPGTHNAINSLSDWEQKLNIPGNGPYTDGQGLVTWEWSKGQSNELWVMVPDRKTVTVKRMDFQMDQAAILRSVPIVSSKQIVTNNSNVDQEQTLTFSVTKGSTYSFTRESGFTLTEKIEFKAGLPLVGETSVEIQVEGSRTYSEENTQEETEEVTLEVPVTVPAHTSIEVSAILMQGIIDVPYTVTFEIEYPDQKVLETASGKFKGVNTLTVTTEYKTVERV